jgi:hypothetical protein
LGGGVIGMSRFSQKTHACKQFFNWYYSDDIAVPGFTIRRYEFAVGTAIQKLILNDLPPEHAAIIAQTLYDYR